MNIKKLIDNYKLDYTKKGSLMNFKRRSAKSYCPVKTHKSDEIKMQLKIYNEYIETGDLKRRPIVASSENLIQRLNHL